MPSAEEWNRRFRKGEHLLTAPDAVLEQSARYFPLLPRRQEKTGKLSDELEAVDLACGSGRHAVYLAQAGFATTAIDFSSEALSRTEELAAGRGVSVTCRRADLEDADFSLGEGAWDLTVVTFFLHRPLFASLRRCLRTGGLIVYKTYSTDQLRYAQGPRGRMHLLEPNELLREFREFRVLRYEEEWEGRGTAALIAQKT